MANVLLIEPDIMLSLSYAKALMHDGHQTRIVRDAQMAINACDTRTPDVVILELQLAAHNGIEFLYEFRSYPEWQHIPVLILSMVPPTEFAANRVLWHELGVVARYYKPHTSLRDLMDYVENCATASV